ICFRRFVFLPIQGNNLNTGCKVFLIPYMLSGTYISTKTMFWTKHFYDINSKCLQAIDQMSVSDNCRRISHYSYSLSFQIRHIVLGLISTGTYFGFERLGITTACTKQQNKTE